MTQRLTTLAVAIVFIVTAIYCANALIISGFTPRSTTIFSKDTQGTVINYVERDDFSASALLKLPAEGYVNVMTPDKTIYLTYSEERSPMYQEQLVNHEAFHLVQKEIIAERAGGYPSVWKPWTTARFLHEAWKMNKELEPLMPPVVPHKHNRFTSGLESAADCAGQQFAFSDPNRQQFLWNNREAFGGYIVEQCDWASLKIVVDMVNSTSYKDSVFDHLSWG